MAELYLHLGNETAIPEQEVIGIFDLDKCSVGKATKDFLSRAEENMQVTDVSFDLPKSFIIAEYKSGDRIYLSALSPKTLTNRTDSI